jgi:hypothetical protein
MLITNGAKQALGSVLRPVPEFSRSVNSSCSRSSVVSSRSGIRQCPRSRGRNLPDFENSISKLHDLGMPDWELPCNASQQVRQRRIRAYLNPSPFRATVSTERFPIGNKNLTTIS